MEDEVQHDLDLSVDLVNLSDTKLSDRETKLLAKGLKFAIKDKKADAYDILTNFELVCQQLNSLEITSEDKGIEKDLKMNKKQVFFQNVQKSAVDYIKNVSKGENSLTEDELDTLKMLSKKDHLVIAKADKGNAVVVQDKQEYVDKMLEVLSDKTKFVCLPDDPTIEREVKLQRSLYALKNKGNLSEDIYNKIRPTGSKCGTLYGLRKVHKGVDPKPPGRPIISAIGTYTQGTAKYLASILKPLRDDAKYSLKDTFEFVEHVKKMSDYKTCQMASYDIVSLFTNVPVKETIEIILDKAYSHKYVQHAKRTRTILVQVEAKRKGAKTDRNKRYVYETRQITESVELFNGLERHQLRKLLVICTQKSHFQFKGNYFDQIDGVAMGGSLGPFFAEFFMDWFENKYMDEIKKYGVVSWKRFVDDIFILFSDSSKSTQLLEFLNSKHPNIKFTEEKEKVINENKSELPFLDVLVTRDEEKGLETSVYRKKTFTGTYLHWNSLTPREYKIGLINCLIDRAQRICSNEALLKIEIAKIKKILTKNEYPTKVVRNTIQRYFSRKQHPKTKIDTSYDVPKKKVFLVLPYYKGADEIKSQLTKYVEQNYLAVDFRFAFKAHSTLSRCLSFKDKINQHMKSKIVYQINCLDCKKFYIGKTKRQLGVRVKEHRIEESSSVHKHMIADNHRIDWDEIKIIDSARDDRRLLLKEMLHINKLKPELNIQKSSKLFSLLIGERETS